jgi:MoxR-like ATPase
MTDKEVCDLFSKYTFQEAKKILQDEAASMGYELMGHETVFELKSLVVQGSRNTENIKSNIVTNAHGTSNNTTECEPKYPEENSNLPTGLEYEVEEGDEVETETHESKEGGEFVESEVVEEEGNTETTTQQEQEQQGNQESEESESNDESQEGEPQKQEQEGEQREEPKKRRGRKRKEEKEQEEYNTETPEEKENEAKKKFEEAKKLMEEAEELRKQEEERKRKEREEEEKQTSRHYKTDAVVKMLKTLHKAFLVGPAGTGKSTLAMQACKEIFGIEGTLQDVVTSGKFAQISFSPDTVSADMLGFTDVNGVFHETDIIKVFREGGVILFDEMDDADASLLVKLNTMLANGVIPTPNGMVTQNENTYIVGTANTYGTGGNSMYVGRSRLDGATLDRWKLSTIFVDYDTNLENNIIMTKTKNSDDGAKLLKIVAEIRQAIASNKWKQICSTRFVIDGVKCLNAGYKINQIVDTFLLSWDESARTIMKRNIRDALHELALEQ